MIREGYWGGIGATPQAVSHEEDVTEHHIVLWDEYNKPGVRDVPNVITMSDYQLLTDSKVGYCTIGRNGIIHELYIRKRA